VCKRNKFGIRGAEDRRRHQGVRAGTLVVAELLERMDQVVDALLGLKSRPRVSQANRLAMLGERIADLPRLAFFRRSNATSLNTNSLGQLREVGKPEKYAERWNISALIRA